MAETGPPGGPVAINFHTLKKFTIMGWTSFNFHGTRKEFAYQEFGSNSEHGAIVDLAIIGTTIYIAYKLGGKQGADEGKITAFVILTSIKKNDPYNFSYKVMDESVGPNECKAPKRIIDLLTPIAELYTPENSSYEWANNWRQKCLDNATKKRTPAIKILPGTTIKVKKPLRFSNGGPYDTFKFVQKSLWRTVPDNQLVKFRTSRFEFDIVEVA